MLKRLPKLMMLMLLCLLVSSLLVPGCAETVPPPPPQAEEITIKVGLIADFTGAVACSGIMQRVALLDYFQYIEDENLVPRVKFELLSYDNQLDPGKTVPGYKSLTGQGVHIIHTIYGQDSLIVKPLAAADKLPHITYNSNIQTIDPPAWTFCDTPLIEDVAATYWNWVMGTWDYAGMKRPPNIAHVTLTTATGILFDDATKAYAERVGKDKLSLVSSKVLPMGTIDLSDIARDWDRQGVDYGFCSTPVVSALNLMKEQKDKGYTYNIAVGDHVAACLQLWLQMAGPLMIDNNWITVTSGWDKDSPSYKLLAKIGNRYHTPEELKKQGHLNSCNYRLGTATAYRIANMVKAAMSEGKDPRDNEALYDQLIRTKFDGLGLVSPMAFNETRRMGSNVVKIYKFQSPDGYPQLIADWMPIVSYDGKTTKYYK